MDHSTQSLIDRYGATRVTVRLLDDLSGGAVLGTGMSLSEAIVIAGLYHHTTVSITIHDDRGDVVLGREEIASLADPGKGGDRSPQAQVVQMPTPAAKGAA